MDNIDNLVTHHILEGIQSLRLSQSIYKNLNAKTQFILKFYLHLFRSHDYPSVLFEKDNRLENGHNSFTTSSEGYLIHIEHDQIIYKFSAPNILNPEVMPDIWCDKSVMASEKFQSLADNHYNFVSYLEKIENDDMEHFNSHYLKKFLNQLSFDDLTVLLCSFTRIQSSISLFKHINFAAYLNFNQDLFLQKTSDLIMNPSFHQDKLVDYSYVHRIIINRISDNLPHVLQAAQLFNLNQNLNATLPIQEIQALHHKNKI